MSAQELALLHRIATATKGAVDGDGQGTGTCPVCGKSGKFRFRIGDDRDPVLFCQSGDCRDRAGTPEWLGPAQRALTDAGVPVDTWRANYTASASRNGHGPAAAHARAEPPPAPSASRPSAPPGPDLPTAEQLRAWRDTVELDPHYAEVLRRLFSLSDKQIADADIGYYEKRGRFVLPVVDPVTAERLTVIYRDFTGEAEKKSMVHKGSSGAYLYAPLGVRDDEPVLVCAGEKDCLAALGHGYNAVAFTNGEGRTPPADRLRALTGRELVIVYDNDSAGRKGARKVAAELASRGYVVRVADLAPAGTPEDADVYDVLHDAALGRAALDRAIAAAEAWGGEAKEEARRKAAEQEAEKELARRAGRRLADAEEASRTAVVLPRQTLAEALMADRPEEPPERIRGVHRIGYNTTISAPYKTGKTTFGGNMLRSLADGVPFLDQFEAMQPAGRVGYLNYELTDTDMLDWLQDQGISNTGRIAVLNLRGTRFSLASEQNAEELVRWCHSMEVEVLHLDPHRRAFAGFGSENSNDDVNRYTETLDALKAEAGVADLFLYVHMGRNVGEPGEEHARGATALDDWADQRIVLSKNADGDRFMYADGRLPHVREVGLVYDSATRHLRVVAGNRVESAVARVTAGICTALRTVGKEGANVTELETRLGIKKDGTLKKALSELLRENIVGFREKGREKRYWLVEFYPEAAHNESP